MEYIFFLVKKIPKENFIQAPPKCQISCLFITKVPDRNTLNMQWTDNLTSRNILMAHKYNPEQQEKEFEQ